MMIIKKNIKKLLSSLFCVNMLLACALFASCDHSPEDEETTTEETTTYTGSGLVTFLGTGSLNTDGDVEVTPNGWETVVELNSAITVSSLKSLTVNAKKSNADVNAGINFTNEEDGEGNTVTATITSTDFADCEVDISKCTAQSLPKAQLWLVDSGWSSAVPSEKITIHSITIVKNK